MESILRVKTLQNKAKRTQTLTFLQHYYTWLLIHFSTVQIQRSLWYTLKLWGENVEETLHQKNEQRVKRNGYE